MNVLLVFSAFCPALAGESEEQARLQEQRKLGAPQDLLPFAMQAGMDTVLMTAAEQSKRDTRANQLFFGPWDLPRPGVKAQDFKANHSTKARGYYLETVWSQAEWNEVLAAANIPAYPSALGPAIITRHTDLRSMPTAKPLHLAPTEQLAMDFFDFFQLSSLPLGTPVYVSHVSADKNWLYVEYPLAPGWVRAEDVALVSRAFRKAYAHGTYSVAVQDYVNLVSDSGEAVGSTHVGSVFPRALKKPAKQPGQPDQPDQPSQPGQPGQPDQAGQPDKAKQADQDRILVPIRQEDGTARMESVLPPAGSVVPKPLPLTPGNLARIGNVMVGQEYSWGGCDQLRDCSLTTRDLFLPFGLWLPRNSRSQLNNTKNLAQLSPEARKAAILRDAKPFMTLFGFPGHVGLYVGTYENEPVMLHNILGLRTNDVDEMFRHIIGKCNLSTLEVGKNDPQIDLSETLLDRLNAMRNL